MRPLPVLTAGLSLVLVATGCNGDLGTGEPPRALPSGSACTPPSGVEEGPREFDATALVAGPAVQPGRSVELTICFVPPAAGRAVATVAVEGASDGAVEGASDGAVESASDGVVPTRPTVDWPEVEAGERQVDTVAVTVADGGRATLRTTIELFDAAGQFAGRYIDSTYVLGGADAVFVSEKSLETLDRVALEHERDAGRISDDEVRRRAEELRQPGQLTPG